MEEKNIQERIIDKTEELIEQVLTKEPSFDNLDVLYKLVDIHKDIKNEKYWEMKESVCMRGNYGNYGAYNGYNGRGAGYNAYGNYGEYGRRGYDAKYRGYGHLDRMTDEYGRYQESRERYGAGSETDKSFHYMVEALEDYIKVLCEEAETPQQKQMLMESLQKCMM